MAAADQAADRRADRATEPEPAEPRTRPARPAHLPAGLLGPAAVAVAFCLGAVAVLVRLAVQRGDTAALVALAAGVAGALLALSGVAEWRFRAGRAAGPARQHDEADVDDFATRVRQEYAHHVRCFAPAGPSRALWISAVREPLLRLADELIEVYRPDHADPAPLRWLIRFQVWDLRSAWDDGTLGEPGSGRRLLPVPVRIGIGAAAAVSATGFGMAARISAGALAVLLITGGVAAVLGLRIIAERRRFRAEEAERDHRMTSYWFAYQRWRHHLDGTPDESAWLD